LDENLFRLITTFDEVPPHPCAPEHEPDLRRAHTLRFTEMVLT
jgi:hypothetical protein